MDILGLQAQLDESRTELEALRDRIHSAVLLADAEDAGGNHEDAGGNIEDAGGNVEDAGVENKQPAKEGKNGVVSSNVSMRSMVVNAPPEEEGTGEADFGGFAGDGAAGSDVGAGKGDDGKGGEAAGKEKDKERGGRKGGTVSGAVDRGLSMAATEFGSIAISSVASSEVRRGLTSLAS